MNYSDFSFWWILFLFSVPFLTVRSIAKSLNLWRDIFDGVGLMVVSLLLFFYASRTSFLIFIVELVFNYIMVWLVLKLSGWQAKLAATIVIVINVAVLAYFKYLGFFVQEIIGRLTVLPPNWKETFLVPVPDRIPPGLSFYTFEMIAFVVDSLALKKKKPIAVLEYINFIAFFPKVVAGPIERRRDLLPQLSPFRLKFTAENFQNGMRWLSLGLFMKFVLADNLAIYIELDKMVDNAWYIWFEAFLFTLRIYFDFGGYSFIAVGLAYFLGVRLTVNFLAPYTSQSINEFWRRWHITLSTWFRDYVFIPLMGANKNWAPFYLFLTFTLSGFWHGASLNFVAWGAYHGALLLILRYLGRPFYGFVGRYVSRPQIVSWALTFLSVIFGCLFFMETNTRRLLGKLATLAHPANYSLANLGEIFHSYSLNQGSVLALALGMGITVLILEQIAINQKKYEYDLLLSPRLSPILLGLTILLASTSSGNFIYFDF
ncbi:MBOAT family O-acyltransferase [Pannus brasiliensis CCIBt3594]|uniref:MBOAT family O-acyltransferase n=1 Tax=Pannus brasiliensis CCIBt3594 TaxID=1427578 RepID=A0AAW9QGI3_9CHRO